MQLMSRPETAKFLGIGLSTLKRMMSRGEGPIFLYLGKRIKFDKDDVLEFLNSSKRKSKSGSV